MKKSIIDTYTTIYYVDIVVANKYTTLEELKELYVYSNGYVFVVQKRSAIYWGILRSVYTKH